MFDCRHHDCASRDNGGRCGGRRHLVAGAPQFRSDKARPLRSVLIALFSCLLPLLAHGGAFTMNASGNINDGTKFVGGVAPDCSGAGGDTLTINNGVSATVNVNCTLGTSPAAGNVVVQVGSTATGGAVLTVSSGTIFTVRGDLQLINSGLTMSAGSTYLFDSSLASGTPKYRIVGSSASAQANTRIILNGTEGSHVTISKVAGSGNGLIQRYAAGTTAALGFHATFTDFYDLGSSSYNWPNDAVEMNPSATGQEAYLDHCTFTRVGRVWTPSVATGNDLWITHSAWYAPLSTAAALYLTTSAPTTGQRMVKNNYFEGQVAFIGTHRGFTVENNMFWQLGFTGYNDFGNFASFQNNLFWNKAADNYNKVGAAGDTLLNSYVFMDVAGGEPRAFSMGPQGGTGAWTSDGTVFDSTAAAEDMDGSTTTVLTSGSYSLAFRRELVLPNSRGKASASLLALHGSASTSGISVEHCTGMVSDNTAPTTTAQAAIYTGASGYIGHSGMLSSVKSNLLWSKTPLSQYGWIMWNSMMGAASSAGSATSNGTATSLTDSSKSWGVTTNANLGAARPQLLFTSGANAGMTTTITANTSNTLTFDAVPNAVQSGDQYKIAAVNLIAGSGLDYNATFNVRDGTIYDNLGANAATTHGYQALWITNYSAVGAHDVALSGTDEIAGGPRFVDSSRNLVTFDRAYLGKPVAAAWATSTAYAVGDLVSSSAGGFYGGATINYRCIAAHISGAGTRPGSGSSWRTDWEVASFSWIRSYILADTTFTDATIGAAGDSAISTLSKWVKKGFAPRETALQGAAHDGGDIGAVAVSSSSQESARRRASVVWR